MAYPRVGATTITTGVTTVDCQKQVRSWRLLRSLIELLIPTCNCTFVEHEDNQLELTKQQSHATRYHYPRCYPEPGFAYSNNIITGTIFGYRRGKVSFCIQTTSQSKPILLLELALPTNVLAKEMQGGFLRIALESATPINYNCDSLLATPVWTMYCNSRKVGYAIKRRPSQDDLKALRLMGSVVVGAGILGGNKEELDNNGDEIMYLRANFEKVCGSANSESFHLIDPDESIGQELSIFFYRSR